MKVFEEIKNEFPETAEFVDGVQSKNVVKKIRQQKR